MDILYYIFLFPLETIFKLVLELSYKYTNSYGISIIVLSIIVNISLIPIYKICEEWRKVDSEKKKHMKYMLDRISQNYSGKEKFFYTQAYYKTQNYSPLSTLKASTGLLIQIPFFLAAFLLLSDYEPLLGIKFGIIKDLSQPDQLLNKINLLPFLMVAVNFFAIFVYTNEFDGSEKYQLIGISLIFLFLLYAQPAGLLIYWICCNLFFLVKNLLSIKATKKLNFDKKNYAKVLDNIRNKFLSKNTFIPKFLEKSLIVTIFLTLISYTATKFLPSGINLDFNERSTKYYLSFSVILFLILSFFKKSNIFSFLHLEIKFEKILTTNLIKKLKNISKIDLSKKFEKISIIDLILLLLPLALIFQYIIFNTDLMDKNDITLFIIKSIFISSIFILLIPFILSIFFDKKLICSVATAYIFLLYYMPVLASINNWSSKGSLIILFVILFSLILLIYFLYLKNKKLLLTLVSIFFVFTISNSLYTNLEELKKNKGLNSKADLISNKKFISKKNYHSSDNHRFILEAISNSSIKTKYDIIFMVYESYVNEETMNHYGIDNSEQISFLKEKNFKIYEKNYSIGADTYDSLSRTLNLSSDLGDTRSKNYTAGSNFLTDTLSKAGYKNFGILQSKNAFSGGIVPVWDEYFPDVSDLSLDLFKAVSEGIFRYDFEVGTNVKNWREEFNEKKKEIINRKKDRPYFMYTYSANPGHSQNAGVCMPEEADKKKYIEKLYYANNEMKDDVNTLLEVNPNAIVIIAGDHGPYLTVNCYNVPKEYDVSKINRYHIQDRYGSFLAIHWPNELKKNSHDIRILQDVFTSVLAKIYNNNDIWDKGKVSSKLISMVAGEGVSVENGIITGGKNDGEELFLGITD